MREGDVEYACDSGTLLQLTCLLESQKNRKNSARFSLACELNSLTIPFFADHGIHAQIEHAQSSVCLTLLWPLRLKI